MAPPRIGLDLSLLSDARAASAARWLLPAVRALEARADLETVRLGASAPPRFPLRNLVVGRQAIRERVDGVHAFTSSLPALVRDFGPDRGRPLVRTVHELPWLHGVDEGSRRRSRLWLELGDRAAARSVCPTEHVARDLIASGRVERESVRVLHWGIAEAFAAHERAGADDGPPRLMLPNAGRPKKGAVRAVRALAHLGPDVRLALTGPDGAGRREALAVAEELGLRGRVELLEHVADDDLPRIWGRAAAVLCLADSEGFCLPVAEALAAGTPVVVPAHSAQAEVADGSGVVCDDCDAPERLAEAVGRALAWTDEDRAAARAVGARYTWSRWAAGAADLWRELTEVRA